MPFERGCDAHLCLNEGFSLWVNPGVRDSFVGHILSGRNYVSQRPGPKTGALLYTKCARIQRFQFIGVSF